MSAAALAAEAAKLPAFVRRDWKIAALLPRGLRRRRAGPRQPDHRLLLRRPARRPGQAADLRRHGPELPRVRGDRTRHQPHRGRAAAPGRPRAAPGAAHRARSRRCSPRPPPARRCSSARSPTRSSSCRCAPRSCSARSRSASASTSHASGIAPALVLLLAFLPFTWGLGLVSAAVVVTFRRGASATGFVLTLLGLISGAVFPIALLPAACAHRELEPVRDRDRRYALRADRRDGLGARGTALVRLVPLSVAGLALGVVCFRLAIARERRRGTLGSTDASRGLFRLVRRPPASPTCARHSGGGGRCGRCAPSCAAARCAGSALPRLRRCHSRPSVRSASSLPAPGVLPRRRARAAALAGRPWRGTRCRRGHPRRRERRLQRACLGRWDAASARASLCRDDPTRALSAISAKWRPATARARRRARSTRVDG